MLAKIENGKITWYSLFKKKELDVTEIVWAYIQIEDANARMCCANTSFPIGRLIVVKKDGTRKVFQYEGTEKPKALLEKLQVENPDVAVGYTKENRERFGKLCVV